MQDFIDVVILYNEDFVKAGNTWVRNLRCLPWAPSTTAPVVIRHENYVDARQQAREDGLKTQAKKEHDIEEKPYRAWVQQKKVLADNNDTAGLDAHLLREPAHGATIDQRYQTLRAAAIPPINRAPFATAVPIRQLATHFRGPLSPTCTAAVWRINTIGDLLGASEAAQRQVDNEYNLLMNELEADDIRIDESRINNKIAQQGPDELAMWLIFNSDRELQLLRTAAGISIDAVKRHLMRIPTELDRLGNLARGLAPGPDVHRWNLPQSPTNERPCVPTGISSCLPSVTSFCSGARTVPVQGSRQVHYVFLGATLEDHESWPEVRVIRRQQRIAFTRGDEDGWKIMINEVAAAERTHMIQKFGSDFRARGVYSPKSLPTDQRDALRAFRRELIAGTRTVTIPRGGNNNINSHIVQAFTYTGDLYGMVHPIQACLSCKVSLRQMEAMQVPTAYLVGMLDQFAPLARNERATTCAEVIMSQYCICAGHTNKPQ